jgi:hypothetical protein
MANVPRVINLASSLLLKSAPYPVRSLIFIANLDFTNPFRVEKSPRPSNFMTLESRSDWHSESPMPIAGRDLHGVKQACFITTGGAP